MRVAAVPLLWLVVGGAAAAAGPTDIARVDEFIDAPRALLGRTRAELERTLGPPAEVRARAGAAVLLSWPGLDIAVSRSSRVAAVVLRAAGQPRTAASARPRCRPGRAAAAASAPCAAAPRAPRPSRAASGRASAAAGSRPRARRGRRGSGRAGRCPPAPRARSARAAARPCRATILRTPVCGGGCTARRSLRRSRAPSAWPCPLVLHSPCLLV